MRTTYDAGHTTVTAPGPAGPPTTGPRWVRTSRAWLVGVLAAAVVGAGAATGAAAITSRHQHASDLRSQVAALQQQLAAQTSAVTALTSQQATLTASNTALTASNTALAAANANLRKRIAELTNPGVYYASVTIEKAVKDTTYFNASSAYFLVVDVVVANHDATRTESFITSDFVVKSPDGRRFPILDQSPVASQPRFVSGVEKLPGGRVQVLNQDVKPGQSLRGSLVFYVTDTSLHHFTISYRGGAPVALTV